MSGYIAEITDTHTGETRRYSVAEPWDDSCQFQWEENNYACDCNRYIFFQRAIGEYVDDERPCGDGRYDVKCVALDGTVLYDETDPQPEPQ